MNYRKMTRIAYLLTQLCSIEERTHGLERTLFQNEFISANMQYCAAKAEYENELVELVEKWKNGYKQTEKTG